MSVEETSLLLEQFKQHFLQDDGANPDVDACAALLPKLKLAVAKFPTLHPLRTEDISPQELILARETYEYATLLSVKMEDEEAFERHVAKTKTLYNDYNTITSQGRQVIMPKSEKQNLILGLNLLFLLSQNRMAEFHTELELIPIEMHSNLFVKHPVTLEQYLMEGSYNKVIAAQHTPPAESYKYFMSILITTVKDEIAECCERAYQSLSVAEAQSMLMCESEAELREYVSGREDWSIEGDTVSFGQGVLDAKDAVPEVPSGKLIMRALEYAKELERIV